MMTTRRLADGRTVTAQRNDGLRKICGCARRQWSKCPHPWHFNFKFGDQPPYRFSLDKHLGRHIATRGEAREHADRIRAEIRAGTFTLRRETSAAPAAPVAPEALTFIAYGAIFVKLCPKRKGKSKGKPRAIAGPDGKLRGNDVSMLNRLATAPGVDEQPLGPRPIGTITQADLETAMASLRGVGRAASTRNKYLVLLRLLSKWGIRKGYLTRSWFTDADEDSPDLTREKGKQRDRRIEPDEEARLLKHATPWLQRLILAELETACRPGELLALLWGDVSLVRAEFRIRDSKTGAARTLPISPKLRAILEMVQRDPAGDLLPPTAHVFGDAIGRRVSFPYKAWEPAVLRAHGYEPAWTATKGLTREARAELRAIDLEFKDLRHEAGSRMLEAGWPLHHIQLMLGHTNIAQTSTYLNAKKLGLKDSMQRFGTAPLQGVANAPRGDHPPTCNDEPLSAPEVTVN